MTRHTTTCEVCERPGPTDNHPCRFGTACACWYGVPCDPPGADIRKTTKTRHARAIAGQEARS